MGAKWGELHEYKTDAGYVWDGLRSVRTSVGWVAAEIILRRTYSAEVTAAVATDDDAGKKGSIKPDAGALKQNFGKVLQGLKISHKYHIYCSQKR